MALTVILWHGLAGELGLSWGLPTDDNKVRADMKQLPGNELLTRTVNPLVRVLHVKGLHTQCLSGSLYRMSAMLHLPSAVSRGFRLDIT